MTKHISALLSILLLAQVAVSQETDTYTIPLRFSVIGNGVDKLPIELDYDLSTQTDLRIGDAYFSTEDFKIMLGRLDEISPTAGPYAPESDRQSVHLVLKWPMPLVPEGNLEAIGQSGRILWQTYVRGGDVASWSDANLGMRQKMATNVKKEDLDKNPLLTSTWGFKDFISSASELIKSRENFRLCLTRQVDRGQSRICSSYMSVKNVERKWRVDLIPGAESPARIISFQKASPLKAIRRLKTRGAVQFLAELNNGMIYEFVTRPPSIEIVEFVKTASNKMRIVGYGQPPAMDHRILNPQEESFLVRTFKWQETIGDFRQFWEVEVPLETTTLYFPGPSGGLFKQQFKVTRIPREAIRPYIDYRTPNSTYVDGSKVFGIRAKETKLGSKENELETDDSTEEFTWYFRAQERGALNRSHLEVTDGDQTYRMRYEMFKGYPRELSVRTSAIVGSGGNLLLTGEGAFNYWFEDIMGWSNYWLSKQRWGVSAKHFQTFTPLKISSVTSALTNTTVDLKYRLNPGLWNRDETWGLILGFNNVTYDTFHSAQMGAGFFWARSMPRLFDDLINKISIMRYPKWVDLEFIYYPMSLNSDAIPNNPPVGAGSFALNFHGKVMWTKSFFGEGGFGVKNLDFNQETMGPTTLRRLRLQFASVYGTVGIGYQF